MARTDWKRLAAVLADRLASHAFCDQHPASHPEPDCPWCGDRTAYRAYLAAGGRDFRIKAEGRSVPLAELSRRTPEGGIDE